VRALAVLPGKPHSTQVVEVPDVRPREGEVLLRTLEVGVCGTDREIDEGLFGAAPEGEERLVIGHESLARVERDGNGFARGDLVAATVRRPCGECAPCAEGAPDSCETGRYRERGIMRLHGFASELVVEAPENLVAVPRSLGRLGVLAEPASVCERGLRHARAIGGRQPWSPRRTLVLGAGAIGMLTTYLLRLADFEVWTVARGPSGSDKAELVEASGARYVSISETPVEHLVEDVGGFDVVVEATGNAQLMLDAVGMLRRNGVACLLGLDGRAQEISVEGKVIGVDAILGNRALFGSVNAHRVDWRAAVGHLDEARARWPEALEQFVGLRVDLDRFQEAFDYRGVKATLRLADE